MDLINNLREMNFTESEAKVYLTLLKHGRSTGYEVSKYSGVSRSKIYNHLEELLQRGVLESSYEGDKTYYQAIPADDLVDLTRSKMNKNLDSFQYLASKLPRAQEDDTIWHLEDYDRMILKALEIIGSAEESLHIQIWTRDVSPELSQAINDKIDQLDRTLVILYDEEQEYDCQIKKFFPHGFEMERLEDMTHRWITIVADEEYFLYSAILFNNEISGIYSKNKILSFFAREYVQHDAYCVKLIDMFQDELIEEYGEGMDGVRDIYS